MAVKGTKRQLEDYKLPEEQLAKSGEEELAKVESELSDNYTLTEADKEFIEKSQEFNNKETYDKATQKVRTQLEETIKEPQYPNPIPDEDTAMLQGISFDNETKEKLETQIDASFSGALKSGSASTAAGFLGFVNYVQRAGYDDSRMGREIIDQYLANIVGSESERKKTGKTPEAILRENGLLMGKDEDDTFDFRGISVSKESIEKKVLKNLPTIVDSIIPQVKKKIKPIIPQETIDDLMLYAEENAPKELSGKDFIDLFGQGEVFNAGQLLAYQTVQLIPQVAGMMVASAATGNPLVGISMIGVSATGLKYEQVKDNENMTETAKMLNPMLTGAAEIASEYVFGFGKIFRRELGKGLAKALGREVTKTTGKAAITELKAGVLAGLKRLGVAIFKGAKDESFEEPLSQWMENIVDIFTNNRDKYGRLPKVMDGVGVSYFLGLTSGGAMGAGSHSLAGAIRTYEGYKSKERRQARAEAFARKTKEKGITATPEQIEDFVLNSSETQNPINNELKKMYTSEEARIVQKISEETGTQIKFTPEQKREVRQSIIDKTIENAPSEEIKNDIIEAVKENTTSFLDRLYGLEDKYDDGDLSAEDMQKRLEKIIEDEKASPYADKQSRKAFTDEVYNFSNRVLANEALKIGEVDEDGNPVEETEEESTPLFVPREEIVPKEVEEQVVPKVEQAEETGVETGTKQGLYSKLLDIYSEYQREEGELPLERIEVDDGKLFIGKEDITTADDEEILELLKERDESTKEDLEEYDIDLQRQSISDYLEEISKKAENEEEYIEQETEKDNIGKEEEVGLGDGVDEEADREQGVEENEESVFDFKWDKDFEKEMDEIDNALHSGVERSEALEKDLAVLPRLSLRKKFGDLIDVIDISQTKEEALEKAKKTTEYAENTSLQEAEGKTREEAFGELFDKVKSLEIEEEPTLFYKGKPDKAMIDWHKSTEELLSPNSEVKEVRYLSDEEFQKILQEEGNNALFQSVYHGSPHNFDKFSTDRIGTGEGNQAFGWGLYFTDLKEVANAYSGNNLYSTLAKEGYDHLSIGDAIKYFDQSNSVAEAIGLARKELEYAKQNNYTDIIPIREQTVEIIEKFKEKPTGNIYKAKIHGDKSIDELNFLNWGNKAKPNQIRAIEKALERLKKDKRGYEDFEFDNRDIDIYIDAIREYTTGDQIYGSIAGLFGTQKDASLFLLNAGIDGIRYPADIQANGSHENAYNYVVFDENAVEIEERIQFQQEKNTVLGAYNPNTKTIYINKDKANKTTLWHEFSHPFIENLRKSKSNLYEQATEILKGSEYETWAREQGYAEDILLNEALAQAIADNGVQLQSQSKIRRFVELAKQIIQNFKEVVGKMFGKGYEPTLKDITTSFARDMAGIKSYSKISKELHSISNDYLQDAIKRFASQKETFNNSIVMDAVGLSEGSPMEIGVVSKVFDGIGADFGKATLPKETVETFLKDNAKIQREELLQLPEMLNSPLAVWDIGNGKKSLIAKSVFGSPDESIEITMDKSGNIGKLAVETNENLAKNHKGDKLLHLDKQGVESNTIGLFEATPENANDFSEETYQERKTDLLLQRGDTEATTKEQLGLLRKIVERIYKGEVSTDEEAIKKFGDIRKLAVITKKASNFAKFQKNATMEDWDFLLETTMEIVEKVPSILSKKQLEAIEGVNREEATKKFRRAFLEDMTLKEKSTDLVSLSIKKTFQFLKWWFAGNKRTEQINTLYKDILQGVQIRSFVKEMTGETDLSTVLGKKKTFLDYAEQKLSDSNAILERVQRDLEKIKGDKLTKAEKLADNRNESIRRAGAEAQEVREWVDRFFSKIIKRKLYRTFTDYVYAIHALKRNEVLNNKNIQKLNEAEEYLKTCEESEVKDVEKVIALIKEKMALHGNDGSGDLGKLNYSGMSNNEANQILKKIKDNNLTEELESYRKDFYNNITKRELDVALQSGMKSKEEIETLMNAYGDTYISLADLQNKDEGMRLFKRTEIDEDLEDISKNANFFNKGKKFKDRFMPAEGRISRAEHIFSSTISKFSQTLEDAERYTELQNLARFAIFNKNPFIAVTGARKATKKSKVETKILGKEQGRKQNESVKISFPLDGKEVFLEFKDKQLAEAFIKKAKDPDNVIIRGFYKAIRLRKETMTTLSPSFLPSAFVKDVFESISKMGMYEEELKNLGLQHKWLSSSTLKKVSPNMLSLFKYENGKASDTEKARVKDFIHHGGKMGLMTYRDGHEVRKSLIREVKLQEGSAVKRNLVNVARSPFRSMERIATATENSLRFSLYEELVGRGMSKSEAGKAAANITINFAKKGDWSRALSSVSLFYNPSVRSNLQVVEAVKKSKKVRWMANSFFLAPFLALGLRYLFGGGNNDDEFYAKTSQYERDNYLILPFAKIPLPWGFKPFYTAGQCATEVLTGRESIWGAIKRTSSSLANSFSPFSSSEASLLPFPLPTEPLFSPIIEAERNINFFGSNIYSEWGDVDFKKAFSKSTWGWLEKATTYLGQNEIADINPAYWQHIVEGYGNGVVRFAENVGETTSNFLNGKFDDFSSYPVVGGFARKGGSLTAYYNAMAIRRKAEKEELRVEDLKLAKVLVDYFSDNAEAMELLDEEQKKRINGLGRFIRIKQNSFFLKGKGTYTDKDRWTKKEKEFQEEYGKIFGVKKSNIFSD